MLSSTRFTFDPRQLGGPRPPGISAFMRIKNGEEFLEATIESHIGFFDEIVAVHNDCSDGSLSILRRLRRRHGGKLRILCYEPKVHALGSAEHRRADTFSVNSFANYSNYCLANTRYSVVTKLDDDHVAIPRNVAAITSLIRQLNCELDRRMLCFSGVNLVAKRNAIGVHTTVPFAGNGDHWFVQASSRNYFRQDRRFERFNRRGLQMEYHGISYWHLKFLKKENGFKNYKLDKNPDSRFHKQRKRFEEVKEPISLGELERRCRTLAMRGSMAEKVKRIVSDKARLRHERNTRFDAAMLQSEFEKLHDALTKCDLPEYRAWPVAGASGACLPNWCGSYGVPRST
ncbi:MAG: glycosyl transferase [Planctomycetota bacterium]